MKPIRLIKQVDDINNIDISEYKRLDPCQDRNNCFSQLGLRIYYHERCKMKIIILRHGKFKKIVLSVDLKKIYNIV